MFLLSSGPEPHSSPATTLSGLILLAGYIAFDNFTSNWQDALFAYKMSSVQMMFGVSLFSCLFTVGSLLEQGALLERASASWDDTARVCGTHPAAVHLLCVWPALHLLHHRAVWGCHLHHHHDPPPGLRHPPFLPPLRPHCHCGGGPGVAVVFAALLLRVCARGRPNAGKKAVPVESSVQKV